MTQGVSSDSSAHETLRLVQVTDCHLGGDESEQLLGMNTEESFHDVLRLVRAQEASADWLVATGDIASRGAEGAYSRFLSAMDTYSSVSKAWIPGNHDLASVMSEAGEGKIQAQHVALKHWQFILLDTSILGSEAGELSLHELQRLERLLESHSQHAIVFVHHQPVPMKSTWLDSYVINNADVFFTIIDRFPQVKAVVFGHVHQEFSAERNGVKLLATPSTCIQFKPQQEDFVVDNAMPGYRWFNLHANGEFETAVVRVPEKDYGIDFDSAGY